jgi:hypothetical protein
LIYTDASYGTGGIGLRNRGTGLLHVSGVTGPVKDAYLYWSILFSSAQPSRAISRATLTRIYPSFSLPITLQGTLLGIAPDPNWGSNGAAVYRAQVPRSVAAGNGAYEVIIASGSTNGSDPWAQYPPVTVFPLAEGASLVIVGTGNWTVGIYDAGMTAQRACATETLSYTLAFPAPVTADAWWDNIGADGQVASGSGPGGRLEAKGVASETTTINGVLVAGSPAVIPPTFETSLNPDSDWNGSAGLPIPQLWDDTGHDIFQELRYNSNVAISFYSPGDCWVTVANVLAVQ